MKNSSLINFSPAQRILHWSVALLIFFNLLFPDGMNAWHRAIRHGTEPSADVVSSANIHAYAGLAILLLAIIRLGLRFTQGVPEEPGSEPPILRIAARIAHATLYALMLIMPLSGAAAYYLGVEAAGSIHAGILKVLLWFLIGVHVAATLVHHFYFRTNVLRRMTIG